MKKALSVVVSLACAFLLMTGCGKGKQTADVIEKDYSLKRGETTSAEKSATKKENGISKWASDIKTTHPSEKKGTTAKSTTAKSTSSKSDDEIDDDDDNDDFYDDDDDDYDSDDEQTDDSGKTDEELFLFNDGTLNWINYAKLRVYPFLKNHKIEYLTDTGLVQVVDLNGDSRPDLVLSQYSFGGGHGGFTNAYIYDSEIRTFKEFPVSERFVGHTIRNARLRGEYDVFLSNGIPEQYNSTTDLYVPTIFGRVFINDDGMVDLDIIYDGEKDFDSWKEYADTVTSNYEFTEEPKLIQLTKSPDGYFRLISSEKEIEEAVYDYFWGNWQE